MQSEIFTYIKKRIASEFEKCQWEDGVGKKFREGNLTEMQKSVEKMEAAFEDARIFKRNAERLLASIKEE